MTGILSAFPDNIETFGSGKVEWSPVKVFAFYISTIVVSLGCAYLGGRPSDEALNAILTAVSIIAGFTFSTLIFLVDHKFVVQSDPDSLEQRSLQEKIDRLAESSFKILFYFNIVALLLVSASISGLIIPSLSANMPSGITKWFFITEFLGRALFFFLLVESFVTFVRLLRRLKYLFAKAREKQVK